MNGRAERGPKEWGDADREGEGKGVSIDIGGEEEARLSLSGRLSLENLHYVMAQAHRILERPLLKSLTVDLKGLEGIDSAGGLFLLRMEEEARGRSIPFERFNVSPGVQSIIDLLGPRAIRPGPQPFGRAFQRVSLKRSARGASCSSATSASAWPSAALCSRKRSTACSIPRR